MKITIAHLYPKDLNIYGDRGNIFSLVYRLKQRGIKVFIKSIGLNDPLPQGGFDLLFGGGGQDQQQQLIASDLFKRRVVLLKAAQAGIPMLTICGTYQLFGNYFQPSSGPKIKGIGIFNAYTVASKQRKIGNIIIKANPAVLHPTPYLVGFENHSGNTFLAAATQPLGKVILGFGNNGQDKTEGAVIHNVFGCYLHGSLLPKNPHFCDYLIKLALEKKYGPIKLEPLDDQLEWQAHAAALKRARKLARPLLKYL
ncbi:MAG: glutamine amidotransferase [Candidatus Beckwithbacteria bacterium]|nr:glutamine amidotransferase [Candidatus Beckwithbacteria bacterium]